MRERQSQATTDRPTAGSGTRTAIGVLDQGVFTLGNFLLILVVAHSSSARDFGAFSIAYTSYVLAAELTQAAFIEALVVRSGNSEPTVQVRAAGNAALGAAVVAALVIGLIMVMAGLAIGGPSGPVLSLTGVVLPGLIVQGGLRRYCLSTARPGTALVNDAVWLSTQTIALILCLSTGRRDVELLLLCWAGTGNLAALIGLLQTGAVPRPRQGPAWWKETRRTSMSYTLEYLVLAGTAQALVYMVAVTSGLQATAGLRAGLTVFGPLNVAVITARAVVLPEFVRLRTEKHHTYRRAVLSLSLCCGALALMSGVAAGALPAAVGILAFGASWSLALPLLVPLTIHRTLLGLAIGPATGMRAAGSAVESTRARATGAVAELAIGTLGALGHGAVGAAYGLAAGSATGLLLTWSEYRRSERRVADAGAALRNPSTRAEVR
jgi:hypothetical protein